MNRWNRLAFCVILSIAGLSFFLPACQGTRPVSPVAQVTVVATYTPCGWPSNTCTPTATFTPTNTWTSTPTNTPTITPTCVGASGTLAAPVTNSVASLAYYLVTRPVTLSGRVRITDFKLTDYCTSSATTLYVGLYSDSGGYPSTLVTSLSTPGSSSGACGTTPVTFTFSTPPWVNPGSYWLVVIGSGTYIWLGSASTGGLLYYYGSASLPSTFPSFASGYYPPVLSADWVCP